MRKRLLEPSNQHKKSLAWLLLFLRICLLFLFCKLKLVSLTCIFYQCSQHGWMFNDHELGLKILSRHRIIIIFKEHALCVITLFRQYYIHYLHWAKKAVQSNLQFYSLRKLFLWEKNIHFCCSDCLNSLQSRSWAEGQIPLTILWAFEWLTLPHLLVKSHVPFNK